MQIDPQTVCGLILQIRQFDGKTDLVDPDSGSNASDADAEDISFTDVLQNTPRDSIEDVIRAQIGSMNEDQQAELVALAWIGRGDFAADQFAEARGEARGRREGPTADYLLGQPMLGDLLAEGLAAMGQPCEV